MGEKFCRVDTGKLACSSLCTVVTLAWCILQVAVPDDMKDTVASWRAELVERIAEVDEAVGELFLLEEPVDNETLKAGIRRATLALKFVPVFMGRSVWQSTACKVLL